MIRRLSNDMDASSPRPRRTPPAPNAKHYYQSQNRSNDDSNSSLRHSQSHHHSPLEDDDVSEVTCDISMRDLSRSQRQNNNQYHQHRSAQQQHQQNHQQQQPYTSSSSPPTTPQRTNGSNSSGGNRASGNHKEPSSLQWGEQMALLKLELANCKAECDRTQWRFGQLLERKQQADRKVTALERENRELKLALRSAEKKYLVLSMNNTTNTLSQQQQSLQFASPQQQPSLSYGDSDSHSISVSTAGQSNPYRTIHEDDEEDDHEDDGLSVGWRHNRLNSSDDQMDDAISVDHSTYSYHTNHAGGSVINSIPNKQRKSQRGSPTSMGASVIDTAQHHPAGVNSSESDHVVLHGFQDITIETPEGSKTLDTSSTSPLYPDDDPFSTLNPYDGNDDDDNKSKSSWWSWGRPNTKA